MISQCVRKISSKQRTRINTAPFLNFARARLLRLHKRMGRTCPFGKLCRSRGGRKKTDRQKPHHSGSAGSSGRRHLVRAESVAVTPRDVYIAATRLVMRCVVVLFAEARELLPRTDPIYNDSYSLQGLREQLDRMAGGRSADTLRHQWSAWPRLLSLFRLIYEGSSHEGLLVRQYGGGLFQPGEAGSTDPILRALALFEHPKNEPSDHAIHHILELLTRAWERVPQGRATKLILSPIDFSDLSTEYIGILYEGLLDFQLRRAEADSPIVFLNLGDQPALPFLQLDAMPADEIAKLFEKFKVADKKGDSGDDEADEAGEENEEESPEEGAEAGDVLPEVVIEEDLIADTGDASQDREQQRQRIHAWARRAAEAAKLVKKPKGKPSPEKQRSLRRRYRQGRQESCAPHHLPG